MFPTTKYLFFSIPFVFEMKLLSFHPTTHLIINHTYPHNTSIFFSIQYLFLHPISCLGWKKLFFSSTIHKQKSHNKLLIYKNNIFLIQFQFWMKVIPTQMKEPTSFNQWFFFIFRFQKLGHWLASQGGFSIQSPLVQQ